MNDFWIILITVIAAVNPAAITLSAEERVRSSTLVGAVALAAGLLLVAVLSAPTLIDWLAVAPESFRTGAGIVMLIQGCLMTANPTWSSPPTDHPSKGPIPLGWPVMANAAAIVGVMTFAVDGPDGRVLVAAGIALAVGAAAASLPGSHSTPLLAGAGRLAGALLVIMAVGLIVSGVRDV
ncbi:MAG: MarC family protein [Dehalococcoidia bacterium]